MARPNANASTFPPIATFAIVVAILYFAKELFIPLAFALLLSFLLGPAVKKLGKWHIPRVPSAFLALLITSAVVAIVGWFVTIELIQIAESLPHYSDNVRRKVQTLQGKSKSLSNFISSVEELGKEATVSRPVLPADRKKQSAAQSPPQGPPQVMPVRIVEEHTLIQLVRDYAGGALRPLGTIGLILVFTLFMLIDREGLRNRLLKLMGQGKLQATTKAMDDAGQRVSRYVLMQFTVNAGFGAVIATGLYFLGVPSYLLWGVLGMFLRFLPYVGAVIAWMLPFVLTVAVSENWRTPLSVTGLFFVTEMIVGNVIEPMLYGVHTGLSAVAIVVSAVFWTVIWGPIGLVLATPLTVCLSVLGRHSPQLEFLNIVLGDEPVLTPDAIFYQRLIALDQQDALNVLETLGKGKPLIQVFDEIVIPALAMAERDRHTGQLDAKREDFILQSINEFVTELSEAEVIPVAGRTLRSTRVFCFPAHGAADEIAAAMCAHFLSQEGFPAIAFPVTDSPGQLIQALGIQADDVVCISAVPPFAAGHARKLVKNIRESGSQASILAGLWGYSLNKEATSGARLERLRKSLSGDIAASLAEAVACAKVVSERSRSQPAKISA
jgi:predicted PurR-regulated permease PerM/methylmalonyl-CoA mutase cobalamin-binding subunit